MLLYLESITKCLYFLMMMSGRPGPEYTFCCVILSEPFHDKQLTEDGKQMTNN